MMSTIWPVVSRMIAVGEGAIDNRGEQGEVACFNWWRLSSPRMESGRKSGVSP